MSETRSIVDRLHDVFNARRFEDLGEVLDEDVLMVIEGTSLRGLTAVRDYLAGITRQTPIRVQTERVLAESDDTLVTLTSVIETSPATPEPATQGTSPPLTSSFLVVHRTAAGRIVEWRVYLDDEPGHQEDRTGPARGAGIHRLMSEQAALRRVATLVAHGAAESEVFAAIVSEAAGLFGEETWLARYGADDSATIIAQHGDGDARDVTGRTVSRKGAVAKVRRSGRPTRVEHLKPRAITGVVAIAAVPLIVQGAPWGALALVSRGPPLAGGIEDRLAQFADLAATAIANAQSRAELRSLADSRLRCAGSPSW